MHINQNRSKQWDRVLVQPWKAGETKVEHQTQKSPDAAWLKEFTVSNQSAIILSFNQA